MILLLAACTPSGRTVGVGAMDGAAGEQRPRADRGVGHDRAMGCNTPGQDWDGDGLSDSLEGCASGRDSDHDKVPDWQDLDSDGDKIADNLEAGPGTAAGGCARASGAWPCDTDGDKVPDYLDADSDNDGLTDGDEDFNGDGLVGCCLERCNQPSIIWQRSHCKLNQQGCGKGQQCTAGRCLPALGFLCSQGETSARIKDSFGDGLQDKLRGSFVCRERSAKNPHGRQPVQLRYSQQGDWRVALERDAKYAAVTIKGAGPKQAAAIIDPAKAGQRVAGLVLSLNSTQELGAEVDALLQRLRTKLAGKPQLSLLSSGTRHRTHVKYHGLRGLTLDLQTGYTSLGTLRDQVLATLLDRPVGHLAQLTGPWGPTASRFVLRLAVVKRFDFKKGSTGLVLDANGDPVDSGDKKRWRLVLAGGLTTRKDYLDHKQRAGMVLDDLSGGTAVALHQDSFDQRCHTAVVARLPRADIIWVVDESGSMSDSRQDAVNNANAFFSRALASGLDFRMGVTGVCAPTGQYKQAVGRFCSRASSSSTDLGGEDRFLLPTEQSIFAACVKNPPGYEGANEFGLVNAAAAVTQHLPRAANAPSRVRPDASLELIVITDEIPNSLLKLLNTSDHKACALPGATQTKVNQLLAPYRKLLSGSGDPEARARLHVIGGVCNNSCGASVAHGYAQLAQQLGGKIADVCQEDLHGTMQQIIDSIVGQASPVVLDEVPVSASLAVALDNTPLARSRAKGFDYRADGNSLVLINTKYSKGSQVVVSYGKWVRGGCKGI